jgi:hypothetical protein
MKQMTLIERVPVHPLLLTGYAVLFLYAHNLADVLPVDVAGPLALALTGAGFTLLITALALRDVRRGAIVTSALVVAFFAFGHLAPGVNELGLGLRTQLAVWALFVVVAGVFAWRARGLLPPATRALNVVSAVLVAVVLTSIVPYEFGRAVRGAPSDPSNDTSSTVATRPGPGRDIYYLVFDRYGSSWSLERNFGIVNEEFPAWLEDQGFLVVPGARANYPATDLSLASTLNMRFLDELSETVGRDTDDRTPAREMLQRHEVGKFLRSQGYRYAHLGSWWEPTADNDIADEVLRYDTRSEFASVLRETTMLAYVERALGIQHEAPTIRQRHREIALYQFNELERLSRDPGMKFVFAHILLPHDPYVFRADGAPISEEEAVATYDGDLYAEQLAYTNVQIRSIVARLLEGPPDSHPIIIIQPDEGPFICDSPGCPTERSDVLGVRLGILGAYFLPGLDVELSPTHSAVNTFRLIFREYFGADLPPLPDRSFASYRARVYDFEDITEMLPLPGDTIDR